MSGREERVTSGGPWARVARSRATPAALAGALLAVAVVWRGVTLRLPGLAEANYEEALLGLTAQGILAGEPAAFVWGHPYQGSLSAYLGAALFAALAPSTAVLRAVPALFSLVAAVVAYLLARRLVGAGWGLLALAWWAVPPAYLTRLGLTPFHYINAVAYGAVILYLTHRAVARRASRGTIWYGLGCVWGLALWDHPVNACYVAASGITVAVHFATAGPGGSWARRVRGALAQPAYLKGLAGFLVGASPLLVWNLRHELASYRVMVAPEVVRAKDPAGQLRVAADHLVALLGGASHWIPDAPWRTTAVRLLYVGLAGLGLWALGRAAWRGRAGTVAGAARGTWLGFLVVALALGFGVAQFVLSSYREARYLSVVYAAVPVLLAGVTRAVWGMHPSLAALLLGGLVVVHGADNRALRRVLVPPGVSPRPVDAVVAFMTDQELRHAFAHFRVAWPLMFESRGAVVASDFHAFMTKPFHWRPSGIPLRPLFAIQAAVDQAARVAYVTHERLGSPTRELLVGTLALLGGAYRTERIGEYTVFHDFRRPSPALREIPPEALTVRASHKPELGPNAIDRNISSRWVSRAAQEPGMSVAVELDRPRRLAKLMLDPANTVLDHPRGLRVEVSADGRDWRTVREAPRIAAGVDWRGGHPRLNVRGKLGIWLEPVLARHVRLTQTAPPEGRWNWSIAELLLYEATDGPAPARAGQVRREDLAEVARLLIEGKAEAVYAFAEANVVLREALPASIRTYRDWRAVPVERSSRLVRLDARNAFLLPDRTPEVEAMLARRGVACEPRALPAGVLYLCEPGSAPGVLYWDHDRLFEVGLPR